MREFSVPAVTTVTAEDNLTDMVWAAAERFPRLVTLRRQVDGVWTDVTAAGFAEQVGALAKGMIAAGVTQGERVGLLSRTSYEWSLTDMAIWAAGGVTVPIYETASAEQARWILRDSGCRALFVETDDHAAMIEGMSELSDLRDVWRISPKDGPGAVEALTARGATVTDEQLHERRALVRADDLATIIYTSGTTARPKGCELTHRNLLAEVRSANAAFPELLRPGNSVLMFLPLAHVLARAIHLAALNARITLGHTPDIRNLVNDLGGFRPTFVLAVPRVFEKVYNGAKQKAHASGRGRVFDAAEATAVAYSRAADRPGGASLGLRLRHAVFDRLVFSKIRAALGGRCVAAVSGGAPLGERLAHFFRGIGVTVYEGYGLTETSAAATVNTPDHLRIGTVGRPLAGTRVGVAEDGEVLISGDIVFRGYWGDETATKEAFTGDWFHTGDLGALDDDGYLRITGRKKEIIVTAGGKNVAPAPLEDTIRAHALVSQCMVVGDQKPYIAALITIDPDFFGSWKTMRGRPETATVADLRDDPELRAEIQAVINEANKAVSTAESIRRFRILPVDFTEATGELTPSLKVRRSHVTTVYADDITALYS